MRVPPSLEINGKTCPGVVISLCDAFRLIAVLLITPAVVKYLAPIVKAN